MDIKAEIEKELRKEAVMETVREANGQMLKLERAHYSVVAFSNLPYHLEKLFAKYEAEIRKDEREKVLTLAQEYMTTRPKDSVDITGSHATWKSSFTIGGLKEYVRSKIKDQSLTNKES